MTVVASGSIAFDYIFTYRGRFREHIVPDKTHVLNLSFLVDTMRKRRGGVATNYAYTLALLGHPAAVLATVGEDGADVRGWLEGLGVDCRGLRVLPGEHTASGYTVHDLDDNAIWMYYGGAMTRAAELGLADAVPDPEAVIIGPNAPEAMFRLVRSLSPKNQADPLAPLLDQLSNTKDAAGRDRQRLSIVLSAAKRGLWDRARGVADEITDAETQRAARIAIALHQVVNVGRSFEDEEGDAFERAAEFVRAAGYAEQSDRGTEERLTTFALLTLAAARAESSRVWESLASLVGAANETEFYASGALTFEFEVGYGDGNVSLLPLDKAIDIGDVFAATARLDFARTVNEARSLESDVPRAYALIAAARTALAAGRGNPAR